jgi:hypothetical protein
VTIGEIRGTDKRSGANGARLFNHDRTGPFGVAAFNMVMLMYVGGQQYAGREISSMLRDAGFRDIEVKPTFGYWSIVTGVKT